MIYCLVHISFPQDPLDYYYGYIVYDYKTFWEGWETW